MLCHLQHFNGPSADGGTGFGEGGWGCEGCSYIKTGVLGFWDFIFDLLITQREMSLLIITNIITGSKSPNGLHLCDDGGECFLRHYQKWAFTVPFHVRLLRRPRSRANIIITLSKMWPFLVLLIGKCHPGYAAHHRQKETSCDEDNFSEWLLVNISICTLSLLSEDLRAGGSASFS